MNTYDFAYRIVDLLNKRKLSITTVESCTGGRIAAAITQIPGASNVFPGGMVTYQTWTKQHVLGINEDLLKSYDVVSEPVVAQMVKCGCRKMKANFAVATTGYAGPASPDNGIPVGTIWIGFGNDDKIITKCLHLGNDREYNLQQTVINALDMILEFFNSDNKLL